MNCEEPGQARFAASPPRQTKRRSLVPSGHDDTVATSREAENAAQEVTLEAERKSARDARYAARSAGRTTAPATL
jgi:Family of unknown function (DUF6481)